MNLTYLTDDELNEIYFQTVQKLLDHNLAFKLTKKRAEGYEHLEALRRIVTNEMQERKLDEETTKLTDYDHSFAGPKWSYKEIALIWQNNRASIPV